tara:strand:+ start:623 stop:865 length:243 start_codon:yes stop_codon:yes gene_type:complete
MVKLFPRTIWPSKGFEFAVIVTVCPYPLSPANKKALTATRNLSLAVTKKLENIVYRVFIFIAGYIIQRFKWEMAWPFPKK